jgi:hypothetical protein
LKESVVNWLGRDGFGSHPGGWLALALVILLLFALRIALLRLVFGLFKRKGDTDQSDRDYWRIHGG